MIDFVRFGVVVTRMLTSNYAAAGAVLPLILLAFRRHTKRERASAQVEGTSINQKRGGRIGNKNLPDANPV